MCCNHQTPENYTYEFVFLEKKNEEPYLWQTLYVDFGLFFVFLFWKVVHIYMCWTFRFLAAVGNVSFFPDDRKRKLDFRKAKSASARGWSAYYYKMWSKNKPGRAWMLLVFILRQMRIFLSHSPTPTRRKILALTLVMKQSYANLRMSAKLPVFYWRTLKWGNGWLTRKLWTCNILSGSLVICQYFWFLFDHQAFQRNIHLKSRRRSCARSWTKQFQDFVGVNDHLWQGASYRGWSWKRNVPSKPNDTLTPLSFGGKMYCRFGAAIYGFSLC